MVLKKRSMYLSLLMFLAFVPVFCLAQEKAAKQESVQCTQKDVSFICMLADRIAAGQVVPENDLLAAQRILKSLFAQGKNVRVAQDLSFLSSGDMCVDVFAAICIVSSAVLIGGFLCVEGGCWRVIVGD